MKLYGITSKFKAGSLVGEVRTHTTLFTSPEGAITHIARIFASEKWGNVLVKWEGNSEFHHDEYNAPNDHLHSEVFPTYTLDRDVAIQELKSELHTHIAIGNQQFTITEYTVKGDADNV